MEINDDSKYQKIEKHAQQARRLNNMPKINEDGTGTANLYSVPRYLNRHRVLWYWQDENGQWRCLIWAIHPDDETQADNVGFYVGFIPNFPEKYTQIMNGEISNIAPIVEWEKPMARNFGTSQVDPNIPRKWNEDGRIVSFYERNNQYYIVLRFRDENDDDIVDVFVGSDGINFSRESGSPYPGRSNAGGRFLRKMVYLSDIDRFMSSYDNRVFLEDDFRTKTAGVEPIEHNEIFLPNDPKQTNYPNNVRFTVLEEPNGYISQWGEDFYNNEVIEWNMNFSRQRKWVYPFLEDKKVLFFLEGDFSYKYENDNGNIVWNDHNDQWAWVTAKYNSDYTEIQDVTMINTPGHDYVDDWAESRGVQHFGNKLDINDDVLININRGRSPDVWHNIRVRGDDWPRKDQGVSERIYYDRDEPDFLTNKQIVRNPIRKIRNPDNPHEIRFQVRDKDHDYYWTDTTQESNFMGLQSTSDTENYPRGEKYERVNILPDLNHHESNVDLIGSPGVLFGDNYITRHNSHDPVKIALYDAHDMWNNQTSNQQQKKDMILDHNGTTIDPASYGVRNNRNIGSITINGTEYIYCFGLYDPDLDGSWDDPTNLHGNYLNTISRNDEHDGRRWPFLCRSTDGENFTVIRCYDPYSGSTGITLYTPMLVEAVDGNFTNSTDYWIRILSEHAPIQVPGQEDPVYASINTDRQRDNTGRDWDRWYKLPKEAFEQDQTSQPLNQSGYGYMGAMSWRYVMTAIVGQREVFGRYGTKKQVDLVGLERDDWINSEYFSLQNGHGRIGADYIDNSSTNADIRLEWRAFRQESLLTKNIIVPEGLTVVVGGYYKQFDERIVLNLGPGGDQPDFTNETINLYITPNIEPSSTLYNDDFVIFADRRDLPTNYDRIRLGNIKIGSDYVEEVKSIVNTGKTIVEQSKGQVPVGPKTGQYWSEEVSETFGSSTGRKVITVNEANGYEKGNVSIVSIRRADGTVDSNAGFGDSGDDSGAVPVGTVFNSNGNLHGLDVNTQSIGIDLKITVRFSGIVG